MDPYYSALISGDRTECSQIVEAAIKRGQGLESIYTDLFTPALYDVGTAWEENRISVATEHIATALTEYLMCIVEDKLLEPAIGGKKVIVSCVANEYHQVGARMTADLLEQMGYDAHFVGANTPIEDTLDLIRTLNPWFIGLSVSVFFNIPSLFEAIDAIREEFPTLPILVGGQALRTMSEEEFGDIPHLHVVRGLHQLEDIVG